MGEVKWRLMDTSRDNLVTGTGNNQVKKVRLVLLCCEGSGSESERLLVESLLEKKGAEIVKVGNAADVMVEVIERGAEGVVVMNKDEVAYVGQMVKGLERYYGKVICWEFDGEKGLRPYGEGSAEGRGEVEGEAEHSLREQLGEVSEQLLAEPVTMRFVDYVGMQKREKEIEMEVARLRAEQEKLSEQRRLNEEAEQGNEAADIEGGEGGGGDDALLVKVEGHHATRKEEGSDEKVERRRGGGRLVTEEEMDMLLGPFDEV